MAMAITAIPLATRGTLWPASITIKCHALLQWAMPLLCEQVQLINPAA